jgi:Domain of unknown function (DUF4129)
MTVSSGGAGRVAGAALLLAAAVAGLRAGGAFDNAPKPGAAGLSGAVLVTVLAAGEGVAFVAFVVVLAAARLRRRRPERAGEPPRPRLPWWAKTLAVLACIFAVATPLALLIGGKARHRTPQPFLLHPGVASGNPGHPVAPPGGSTWPLIAGMVLAIAVVVAVALRARARRHAEDPRPRLAGLIESLAAGRAALAAGRTPREAIIACYAAMERGFAAAGSAPAAADTPAEVLTRATEAGIVRSANAEVLTGLFRRARYSTEPMTSADSASAASALALMQADMQGEDR